MATMYTSFNQQRMMKGIRAAMELFILNPSSLNGLLIAYRNIIYIKAKTQFQVILILKHYKDGLNNMT